jgi:hypothetical protein
LPNQLIGGEIPGIVRLLNVAIWATPGGEFMGVGEISGLDMVRFTSDNYGYGNRAV